MTQGVGGVLMATVFIFLLCFSSVKAQDYWQFPSHAQKRGTNISSKKGIKSIRANTIRRRETKNLT